MSKGWGRFFAAGVSGATSFQKPWRRAATRLQVGLALKQRHHVDTPRGRIAFVSPHPRALEYPRDFLKREPETLAWIDAFAAPCILWDIGANIGAYSLYAALRPGVSVLAFEPGAASYAALCENIDANGRQDSIRAYCVAFSDRTILATLNMGDSNAGGFPNAFGAERNADGEGVATVARQAAIGFSIDDFRAAFALPAPNYLKLDIDGIEDKVLEGGARTLADPGLRGIMVEMTSGASKRNAGTEAALARAGFRFLRWGVDTGLGALNAEFVRG
ncbi:MAG: FkbM family methyltransferase [Stellaceae bacterium]